MTVTWALIADRNEARIFENRGASDGLALVEEILHPEGHLQDRDVVTDRPGRVFDRAGESRHAMERHESPHERIAATFARGLSEKLRAARTANRFDRLVLAAEPTFLGRLRAALDTPTKRLVVGEVPKHLLGAGDRDLAEHLGEVMKLKKPTRGNGARARTK